MPTSLQGRAEKAKSQAKYRVRTLYGMRTEARLKNGWREIRQDAADGVDEVSAQAYEQDVDEHISDLGERLQRKSDRAKRVRRHEIPKENGQLRPLGRPAVEDKRRPWAVTRLLTAIDEQEFRRCRDGDRPHMGALDAVDQLTITRQFGRDHWGGEADIKGFFDHIDQAWMIRMWAERIADRALLWVIKTWLKAGVLDTDGQVRHPVTGTPPGGSISPLLAHVYRHDAWDLWVEKVVKHQCRGAACLIRYADEFVGACERQEEAERCYTRLGQRRGQFGLERSADQTRVMPFSRHPPAPTTSVELLGFECRWDQDRAGKDHVTRRTARKKRRHALTRCTQGGREHRHLRLGVRCARLHATRRGYDHDDGVSGNVAGLKQFFSQALGILQKWLTRRSQRRRDHWAGDTERLAHFKIDRPRIFGRPQTRMAPSKA